MKQKKNERTRCISLKKNSPKARALSRARYQPPLRILRKTARVALSVSLQMPVKSRVLRQGLISILRAILHLHVSKLQGGDRTGIHAGSRPCATTRWHGVHHLRSTYMIRAISVHVCTRTFARSRSHERLEQLKVAREEGARRSD